MRVLALSTYAIADHLLFTAARRLGASAKTLTTKAAQPKRDGERERSLVDGITKDDRSEESRYFLFRRPKGLDSISELPCFYSPTRVLAPWQFIFAIPLVRRPGLTNSRGFVGPGPQSERS